MRIKAVERGCDIVVTCPECRREQLLPLGEDGTYTIDGLSVFPDFVCMAGEHDCMFSAQVTLDFTR